jgi:hypothetical protein
MVCNPTLNDFVFCKLVYSSKLNDLQIGKSSTVKSNSLTILANVITSKSNSLTVSTKCLRLAVNFEGQTI